MQLRTQCIVELKVEDGRVATKAGLEAILRERIVRNLDGERL